MYVYLLRDARMFFKPRIGIEVLESESVANCLAICLRPGTKVSRRLRNRRPNDVAIIEPSVFSNFHH